METGAWEIADIYKRWWQAELFFKWIKQNLKIKLLWGTGENAVFSRIWAALIIPVLLWICRTLDGITASARQILQMIKTTLLYRGSIRELCANKPPRLNLFPPERPTVVKPDSSVILLRESLKTIFLKHSPLFFYMLIIKY
jgi:hypothetical protein